MANLAGLLAQANHLDEAIAVARHTLQVAPDDAATRMNLVIMLFHEGDRPAAVREAERAVAQQPADSVAQTKLGHLLVQVGRSEDAARHFQAALELNPTTPARQG